MRKIPIDPGLPLRGRGSSINPPGRFESRHSELVDDGWGSDDGDGSVAAVTQVSPERVRTIISSNQSPDIPFRYSINPYRGCEHGCIYCFARPTHSYLNLSPGLDFETRLFAKVNAAECLERELDSPAYHCDTIAFGTNTDPYQPVEREWRISRSLFELAEKCNQPVSIVTKNSLVERDLDILAPMAARGLAMVFMSVTTLDHQLARRMEPRASAPMRRIESIRRLCEAGVPVGVLFAPVVPYLNDAELGNVLEAASKAGATQAGYILLRLPHAVRNLFRDWLVRHYPLKAAHVMSRLREMRGGRENDPRFGSRMVGEGEVARLLRKRFAIACKRLGLNEKQIKLDVTQFRRPGVMRQGELFA